MKRADVPLGLLDLIRGLKLHRSVKWEAEDYEEGDDGREPTRDLDEAEAASSISTVQGASEGMPTVHRLLLDIDVPAWLIPSSTPGHSHLYVDLNVLDGDLWDFLDAAAKIGLLEPGYVSACKSRGATSLRLPWISKGEERVK